MSEFTDAELIRLAKVVGYRCEGCFPDEPPVTNATHWWIVHDKNPASPVQCSPKAAWRRFVQDWQPHVDRNQCAEVEAALTTSQRGQYAEAMYWALGGPDHGGENPVYRQITASPEVRCRALLEILPKGEAK